MQNLRRGHYELAADTRRQHGCLWPSPPPELTRVRCATAGPARHPGRTAAAAAGPQSRPPQRPGSDSPSGLRRPHGVPDLGRVAVDPAVIRADGGEACGTWPCCVARRRCSGRTRPTRPPGDWCPGWTLWRSEAGSGSHCGAGGGPSAADQDQRRPAADDRAPSAGPGRGPASGRLGRGGRTFSGRRQRFARLATTRAAGQESPPGGVGHAPRAPRRDRGAVTVCKGQKRAGDDDH